MNKDTYIKPSISIIGCEPVTILAASGRTGDTFHDANTQKDTVIDMNGGDEYHDGDDDLEAAKHIQLWELPSSLK